MMKTFILKMRMQLYSKKIYIQLFLKLMLKYES